MDILESVFLHVADTTIIAIIIIIVTLLLKYLLKTKLSSNWHLMIWIVLLIKLVVPFLPTSIYSIEAIVNKITSEVVFLSSEGILENQSIGSVDIKTIGAMREKQTLERNLSQDYKINNFSVSQFKNTSIEHLRSKYFYSLLCAWLLGAVIFYSYILMIKISMDKKLRRTVRNKSCISDKVEILFEELSCDRAFKKNLPIVFQTFLSSPAIFGFIRPKLLLNDNLIKSLDDNELRHILLHEIVHYKRRDYLLNALLIILQGIYWFNPFIWIAFSKIRLDCEVCCDRDAKEADYKFDVVGFDDNGSLIVGKFTKNEITDKRIMEAVSSAPVIVANGEGLIKHGDGGWGISPRTAIGQKKDGTVVFLVINGRSTNSLGATLLDVQEIMLENKVVNAVVLQSGSSSTMYYNGKVVNVPSDPEGERKVPSIFMALP